MLLPMERRLLAVRAPFFHIHAMHDDSENGTGRLTTAQRESKNEVKLLVIISFFGASYCLTVHRSIVDIWDSIVDSRGPKLDL